MINTIIQLARDATFQKLMLAQSFLDDSDVALRASAMTRSPYHLLAFLILWKMLKETSQPEVLKELNALLSTQDIEIVHAETLNTLIEQLDWHALFSELNTSENTFLKLTLPQPVLNWIEKNGETLGLPQSAGYKTMFIAGDASIIKIETTLQEEFLWRESFDQMYLTDEAHEKRDRLGRVAHIPDLWDVSEDTFHLSDELMALINDLKKNMREQPVNSKMALNHGAFTINMEKREKRAKQEISDIYYLRIATHHQHELNAEIKHTELSSGLYRVFINSLFQGMTNQVEEVIVNLVGQITLDHLGARVIQQQEVSILCGAGRPLFTEEKNYTFFVCDITVNQFYGLFYSSLIGVDLSKDNTADSEEYDPACTITLRRQPMGIAGMILFPCKISHQKIIQWVLTQLSLEEKNISFNTSRFGFLTTKGKPRRNEMSDLATIDERLADTHRHCCNCM